MSLNHIKSYHIQFNQGKGQLLMVVLIAVWCPVVPTSAHHAEISRLNGQSTNGSKCFRIPFAAQVAACGDTERLNQAQSTSSGNGLCGLCGLLIKLSVTTIVVGNCWPVRSSVLPAYLWVGSHLWLRIKPCRTRQSEGIWNVILDSDYIYNIYI